MFRDVVIGGEVYGVVEVSDHADPVLREQENIVLGVAAAHGIAWKYVEKTSTKIQVSIQLTCRAIACAQTGAPIRSKDLEDKILHSYIRHHLSDIMVTWAPKPEFRRP